jgi:hypothetical protein
MPDQMTNQELTQNVTVRLAFECTLAAFETRAAGCSTALRVCVRRGMAS